MDTHRSIALAICLSLMILDGSFTRFLLIEAQGKTSLDTTGFRRWNPYAGDHLQTGINEGDY